MVKCLGLLLLLMVWPARALVYFSKPGCYRIAGRVTDINGKHLHLKSAEGSRSERVHTVELDELPVGLRNDSVISVPVSVDRAGSEDIVTYRARVSEIRFVHDQALGWRWRWLGESGLRGCPK